MITIEMFRDLALSFPEVTEEPHFEKTSFRVRKKIFATYDFKGNSASLKLSETDQNVFSLASPALLYPAPNKWGKQGWTMVDMSKIDKALFNDALATAYCEVAPQKLANLVRPAIGN